MDIERVAALVSELLDAVGEDPARPGLRATPQRVAENWAQMFSGTGLDAAEALGQTIPVGQGDGACEEVSGAVLVRGIAFRSVCEHHLLPFTGTAHLAYLPGADVVGLGSLARVVQLVGARAQVQERLGEEVAEAIDRALSPRGVLVVLDAVHQCMTTRGAAQPGASTLTIAARGVYRDPLARGELMGLIALGG